LSELVVTEDTPARCQGTELVDAREPERLRPADSVPWHPASAPQGAMTSSRTSATPLPEWFLRTRPERVLVTRLAELTLVTALPKPGAADAYFEFVRRGEAGLIAWHE
jgi:hypothetical protein